MPSRDPGRGEVPSGAWSCCLRVGCWPHAGLPFPDWGPGSPLRTVYPATLLVGRAGLGRTIGWFTTGVFLRRRRHLTGPLGTSLRGAPGEGRTLGQGKAAGLAWGPGAWLWNQTLHPLPLHAAEVAGISLLPPGTPLCPQLRLGLAEASREESWQNQPAEQECSVQTDDQAFAEGPLWLSCGLSLRSLSSHWMPSPRGRGPVLSKKLRNEEEGARSQESTWCGRWQSSRGWGPLCTRTGPL